MKKNLLASCVMTILLAGCGPQNTNTTTTTVVTTSSSNLSSVLSSYSSLSNGTEVSLGNVSSLESSLSSENTASSEKSINNFSSSKNSEISSISSNSSVAVSSTKTYQVVENGRTYKLDISQAGISINVPSSIANDTYYKVVPSATGNGKTIFVYPKSLAESVKLCSNGEYGIAITKMPGVAPANEKGAKQFDGFYVTASKPNGDCSSNPYEKDFTNALMNSVTSIQKI